MDGKTKTISLLATIGSINMQSGNKLTLFNNTTALTGVVTEVVMRNPSASLAGGTGYGFGRDTNASDFAPTVDLSAVTAATTTKYVVIRAATQGVIVAAGETFGMQATTGSTGAATATFDVYGYMY
jgi:hypothetical protein